MSDSYRYVCSRMPDKINAFDVVLPKSWKPAIIEQSPAVRDSPCVLASFRPARAAARAELSVGVALIDREVNASDWLALFLEQNGERITKKEEARSEVGSTAIITSEVDAGGERVASMSLAVKDGPRMFLLRGRAEDGIFGELSPIFDEACRSFRLLFTCRSPFSEKISRFTRTHPAYLSFCHPGSWSLTERTLVADRGILVGLRDDSSGTIAGSLTVLWIARSCEPDIQPAVGHHLETLRDLGMTVGQLTPSVAEGEPSTLRGVTMKSFEAIAQAVGGSGDLVVRITAVEPAEQPFHGLVALLGPARTFVPALWAVHKRAAEIVLNSMEVERRGAGSLR